ncbi:MAG: transporter, ATP-binding protein, partial [Arthrobacter koreensis]
GWVRDEPGVRVLDVAGPTAILQFDDDDARQRLLATALTRGSVEEFAPIRPSLSEIYREVTAA